MSQVAKLTEGRITELLKPKTADIIRMIGEDRLKKEISFALQAVNSNELLQNASHVSIMKCIFNIALTGLSLNPISKLAYITPRYINGQLEAIISPSYQGLVKLIADTGSVKTVYAHCVYEGDDFDVWYGSDVSIKHKPKFSSKTITHCYAIAILPDGTPVIEVMGREDIFSIRERSDSYKAFKAGKAKSCIWITDEGEMFRKTVIKRVTKYVPKTDRWNKVNEAIELDNSDYPATLNQEGYIHTLLSSSTYDDDQKDIIQEKVEAGISASEAKTIIEDLQSNQLDPVTQGRNYSATDAKDHVKRITE